MYGEVWLKNNTETNIIFYTITAHNNFRVISDFYSQVNLYDFTARSFKKASLVI